VAPQNQAGSSLAMATALQLEDLREIVQALGPEEGLGNLKMQELKECCKRFGVKVGGQKIDVVERLAAHLLQSTSQAEQAGTEAPAKQQGRPRKAAADKEAAPRQAEAEVAATAVAPCEAKVAKPAKQRGKPRRAAVPGVEAADGTPAVPTPARNCLGSAVEKEAAEVEERPEPLTVLFTAATATPAIPLEQLASATRALGPERTAQHLLGLKIAELRHYCLLLGLQANGSKLELIDLLLGHLHKQWDEALGAEGPASAEATADAALRSSAPGSPAAHDPVTQAAQLEDSAAEAPEGEPSPTSAGAAVLEGRPQQRSPLVHAARWHSPRHSPRHSAGSPDRASDIGGDAGASAEPGTANLKSTAAECTASAGNDEAAGIDDAVGNDEAAGDEEAAHSEMAEGDDKAPTEVGLSNASPGSKRLRSPPLEEDEEDKEGTEEKRPRLSSNRAAEENSNHEGSTNDEVNEDEPMG